MNSLITIGGAGWRWHRIGDNRLVITIGGGLSGWDCALANGRSFRINEFDCLENAPERALTFCFPCGDGWLRQVVNWARRRYSKVFGVGYSAGAVVWAGYLAGCGEKPDAVSIVGLIDALISDSFKQAWKKITTPCYVIKGLNTEWPDVGDLFYSSIVGEKKFDFFPVKHEDLLNVSMPKIVEWLKAR